MAKKIISKDITCSGTNGGTLVDFQLDYKKKVSISEALIIKGQPLRRTYTILNSVQSRNLLPASLCLQKRISEWFGHSTGFYGRVTHGPILFSVRILSETRFLFHNPNIRFRHSKERCNAWFSLCTGKFRTIVGNEAIFFCHFSVIFLRTCPFAPKYT